MSVDRPFVTRQAKPNGEIVAARSDTNRIFTLELQSNIGAFQLQTRLERKFEWDVGVSVRGKSVHF